MSAKESAKARILRAAEDVVITQGVGGLTLQATAELAGMSKGGVLYHFPSRDALVAGMISALVERWNATFVADESDDDSPGAFTRRYVRDVFREYDQDGRENRLSVAVLAAAAADPALLEPLRSQSEAWQKRIENDGLDPIRAATIRLASDGWWLSKMFGLAHTPEMRRRIADDLIALATPDPAA